MKSWKNVKRYHHYGSFSSTCAWEENIYHRNILSPTGSNEDISQRPPVEKINLLALLGSLWSSWVYFLSRLERNNIIRILFSIGLCCPEYERIAMHVEHFVCVLVDQCMLLVITCIQVNPSRIFIHSDFTWEVTKDYFERGLSPIGLIEIYFSFTRQTTW